MILTVAKFCIDKMNIYKVISRKTKWFHFLDYPLYEPLVNPLRFCRAIKMHTLGPQSKLWITTSVSSKTKR